MVLPSFVGCLRLIGSNFFFSKFDKGAEKKRWGSKFDEQAKLKRQRQAAPPFRHLMLLIVYELVAYFNVLLFSLFI